MTRIVITLPLPNRVLSSNSRSCWQAKASATSKARGEAKYAAIHAMQEQGKFFSEHPRLSLRYFGRTKMHPDPGNLIRSIKPIEDGMADAGLFRNDRFMNYGPVEFAVDKKDPRLEVVMET